MHSAAQYISGSSPIYLHIYLGQQLASSSGTKFLALHLDTMAEIRETAPNLEPSTGNKRCPEGLPDGHLSSVKQLQLDLSFAEYAYYASITRAREEEANDKYLRDQGSCTLAARIKSILHAGRKANQALAEVVDQDISQDTSHCTSGPKDQSLVHSSTVAPTSPASSSELHTANRALRTAGWGSVFYLITLDIMGPSNTPFVDPTPSSFRYN